MLDEQVMSAYMYCMIESDSVAISSQYIDELSRYKLLQCSHRFHFMATPMGTHTGGYVHWWVCTLVGTHTGGYIHTLVCTHTGGYTHWWVHTLVDTHTGGYTHLWVRTLVGTHIGLVCTLVGTYTSGRHL